MSLNMNQTSVALAQLEESRRLRDAALQEKPGSMRKGFYAHLADSDFYGFVLALTCAFAPEMRLR